MDRDRMERVAALFAAANGLSPADRVAFLDRECRGDDSLLSEVLELLEQGDQADREDFLGARTWQGETVEPSPEPSGVPGRYENLREHKRGGMGVVYKAWDVKLGRDVAYKVMSAEFGKGDEFRRKFAREAKITAQLQYPGIVPVFELEEDGSGRPAYAMQFVEGANFRDLTRVRQQADDGTFRKWLEAFLSACRIVAFAHKKQYVHGDLSPRNLMIAEGGAAFVVDWGLARYIGPDRSGHEIAEPAPGSAEPATPGFAAPSVRAGGPRTFVTDVYGLGAVLAALVLGLTPEGQPDLDGPGRVVVPRQLRAIIRAAMVDHEEGLYRDAGDLADDIERFLDGERVRADREPWRERAWRSIRRHPARATVVVSSILLLSVSSTSIALVSAARDRAARVEEVALRRTEEARSARQEANWSQATSAMLRCESILSRNPTPELIDSRMIEPFLKALALLGKKPDLPNEVLESLRTHNEAARQQKARSEARGREAAESELRGIIAILERLVGEVPEPRYVRFHLAKSYYGLGFLELSRVTNELGLLRFILITQATFAGKPPSQPEVDGALIKIDKALELLPGSSPHPSEPDSLREFELEAWEVRGLALARLGRFTECLISFERALKLARGPAEFAIQRLRSVFLKAAEVEQSHMPWSTPPHVDHARAIRMADYLVAQPGVSPEAVFNAACAFSLASVDNGTDAEEKELRAKRAIALLAQIEEKGYFRAAKKAAELNKDDALDPLRQRADFLALKARVGKGG